jgi:glutamate-ammonia-ligase adenylyltransferase
MRASIQFGSDEPPSRAGSHSPQEAARVLARIQNAVPNEIYRLLLAPLPSVPDVDSAVSHFERLAERAPGELWRHFVQAPFLLHYALLIFGCSDWIAETLIANLDLFAVLENERSRFEQVRSHEEFAAKLRHFRQQHGSLNFATLLARFKRREYAGILLRDLLGTLPLPSVTAEISSLSDVLIRVALQEAQLEMRQGRNGPANLPLAIVGLGKLGGNELNYSSDIDLLFLYDEGVQGSAGRENFVRLAQRVVDLLSRHTPEGPVFRVDLRLRPQGSQEELAITLPHAIRYYREVAQDWELQALIKARHVAGDDSLTREFLHSVERQVYRPGLNFAAIKTALQSREKIDRQRRAHPRRGADQPGIDVKLDNGGIRDIEFLVQCLQRVYGGAEPWLRSRGTLFALQKLYDKQHLSSSDFQNLSETYIFLRHLEHRLQLQRGRQTHWLRESPAVPGLMARSMARDHEAAHGSAISRDAVRARMALVSQIYRRIVFEQGSEEIRQQSSPPHERAAAAGGNSSRSLRQVLTDLPELQALVRQSDISQHGLRNLERFLSAAGSAEAADPAARHLPTTPANLLRIVETSDLLADALSRHPEDLELLSNLNEASESGHNRDVVLPHFDQCRLQGGVPDELLSSLRQDLRQRMIASAGRDVLLRRNVYAALEERTRIAETVMQAAVSVTAGARNLAVLALGRLGSREFDVLSDADLLFVAEESVHRESAHLAAQQIVAAFTLYTREGAMFAVDTRLRPHGNAGELVSTPSQLRAYFAEEAEPWEALTYLRLRYVAGNRTLGDATVQAVREVLLPATLQTANFAPALREVRKKLEPPAQRPNFKTGPGGLYDIDYVLGVLQIQNQLPFAANLHDRISLLRHRGLLSSSEADTLQANARFLRSLERAIRLTTGKPRKSLSSAEHAARGTEDLMAEECDRSQPLAAKLHEVLIQNRELYLRHSRSW